MLFSLLAFGLSLFGIIHADHISISLSPITLGYLVLAGLFGLFYLREARLAFRLNAKAFEKPPVPESEEKMEPV